MPEKAPATVDWLAGHDPLRIAELPDPVVQAAGFHARTEYVERYWLPVLGPSATFALRVLTERLDDGIHRVPLAELARELGLGNGTSRTSPVVHTLARLVSFHLADVQWNDTLTVRRYVPPLSSRHRIRLPQHLQARHARDYEALDREAAS